MSVPRLSRTVIGTVLLGALAAPALLALGSGGITLAAKKTVTPVEQRVAVAPNVFFPVLSSYAKDTHSAGKHAGTEITAPCGSAVRSATAGTALLSASKTSGPNLVRVVTSKGKLVTYYGYMRKARVTNGQIVAAGQQLGNVGKEGIATRCSLYFAVTNGLSGVIKIDPSKWLNDYVGQPMPQQSLFDDNGLVVASFNTQGAVHTPDARNPGYAVRTPKQVALLDSYKADVVGLQEFETVQRSAFLDAAKDTYGIYPDVTDKNSADSIIWRNSTMEFISGTTISIPYFQGRTNKIPVILLREKANGREAYFMNTHNPASIHKYGDQSKWRAKGIAIERAEVIQLRKTGLPVIFTGDFNDRQNAFCPLTAGKLMISADSVPASTCTPPAKLWIDWVFAAGPARFTQYVLDQTPKTKRMSDHPIVVTRLYLADPTPIP